MASQDIEIRIKTALENQETAKSFQEIQRSMKELKGLALEVGDSNSEAFKRVTSAIGEAKDKIGDLNAVIKSQSGEPIENLSNSFRGLKDAIFSMDFKMVQTQFGLITSSIGQLKSQFLGVEVFANFNEKLDKGAKGFSLLSAGAKDFGKALIATGIGGFVVIIGLAITAFDSLKNAGGGLGAAMAALGILIEGVKDGLMGLLQAMGLVAQKENDTSKQYIQNKEKEIDAINRRKDAAITAIDEEIAIARARGEETKDIEKKKNEEIIKQNRDLITNLNLLGAKNIGTINELEKKKLDWKEKYNQEEIQSEIDKLKTIDIENNNQIIKLEGENRRAALNNEILDITYKKNLEDRNKAHNEKLSRQAEEKRKKDEELIKSDAILKYNQQLEDEKRFDNLLEVQTNFKKSEAQIDADWADISSKNKSLTYDQILQKLTEQYKKEEDLFKDKEQKKNDALKASVDFGFQVLGEDYQAKIDYLDTHYAEMGMSDYEYYLKRVELEDKITEKGKEENEKRKKDNADALNAALDGASSLVNALSGLEQVNTDNKLKGLKKGSDEELKVQKASFQRQKALSLVMAAIDGAKAITAILSVPDFTFGVASAIRIAAAIATTAIQIGSIASKQFDGSGGGGAPPPAPTPPMNALGPVSAPSTIGLGQMKIETQKPKSEFQRVYVVESDIRNVTNKVEVIENRSILGS